MPSADAIIESQDRLDTLSQLFPEETIKPEFQPIGITPLHMPSKGSVDPDTSKTWFWRVFPILYTHKLLVILSLALSVAAIFIGISIPAVIGKTIDIGLVEQAKPILPYFYLLILLGVGEAILSFFSGYIHGKLSFGLDYDLRTIIYGHLTRLSFSYYDKVQSGQLISRANSDIQAIVGFLTGAPQIFQACMTFVFALAYMLTMHVGLTLVAILALPAVYVLSARMRRVMFPLSWLNQARMAEVTTIADESINGARVVKSFIAEIRQIKSFADASESLRWSRVQEVKLSARFMPTIGALPMIGLALILLYGGYLIIEDEMTIGTLVAFNTYVVMIAAPFGMFAMFLIQYERARASAQRIYEILDEKSEVTESPAAIDLPEPKGKIEFRNVSFGYHQSPRLFTDLDLSIEPGESVAIVGRTGSGKSTVVRLLARFYDPDEGAVCVDDIDVRDLTLVSLRARIGMVLDEPFLFSTSIRENIAYGRPDATLEEIVQAAESAQAHTFILDLPEGYDSVIGERGYTLSGGQRQRIAIARTLLVDPAILVLDDATSSIDVQIESEIHKALRALMKGRTTIVIAHRLSSVRLCDRVVLIDNGRIVASGTHEELMAGEPRYVEVLTRSEAGSKPADEEVRSGGRR